MANRALAAACLLLSMGAVSAPVAGDQAGSEPPEPAASPAVERFGQARALVAAGEFDAAMDTLRAAIEAGFQGHQALRNDPALAPLRDREDWAPLVAQMEQRNPWLAVIDFKPREGSPWTEYAIGRRALDQGDAPGTTRGASGAEVGYFSQLQAQRASLVGDYDYAHANYFGGIRDLDVSSRGIVRLQPALPALASLVDGRNVVMLNESHGHSNQRAANFLFVRELRKLGFTHLALEALTYTRTTEDPCRSSILTDSGLHERGYPIKDTGHYLDDPIYAELVRMALAEGYTLVAYDHGFPDPRSPQREQEQARNIACVFEDAPEARIVVIGGGAHINKGPDERMEGGMMGRRLTALLDREPLAITNSVSRATGLDDAALGAGYVDPAQDGLLAGQPYFAYTAEGGYAPDGYDQAAYIPVPADRSANAGWLRLGGWRVPAPAVSLACEQAPCLLEARREGEDPKAVPGDRCVVEAAGQSCQLFLAPGEYEATLLDANGQRSSPQRLVVTAAG